MAHNLTETSTFDANVSVPDDGDDLEQASVEPAFQALANRTQFLNDAVDAVEAEVDALQAANAYGRYFVTGTPDGSDRFTLTQIAANELTVGSSVEINIITTGLYIVCLTMDFKTSDTSNPADCTAVIYEDGNPVVTGFARRFSGNANTTMCVNATAVIQLTAGKKVSVRSTTAGADAGTNAFTKILSIGRLA